MNDFLNHPKSFTVLRQRDGNAIIMLTNKDNIFLYSVSENFILNIIRPLPRDISHINFKLLAKNQVSETSIGISILVNDKIDTS